MTFEEAEAKFKELQTRVQRGEPISRAEYEAQVSQLGVYDEKGTLWEINPRTGKWMQFDGAEWVPGRPPGRDHSTVMPLAQLSSPPSGASPRPAAESGARVPFDTVPRSAARPAPTIPPAAYDTRPITPDAPAPRPAAARVPAQGAEPQTYKIASDGKKPPTPPPARGMTGGGAPPEKGSRLPNFGNRPWLIFAIGAVVLLICAVGLFAAAQIVQPLVAGPTRTATRLALPPSPTPTKVTFPPTPTPTNTPVPVIAKVNVATTNVRNAPNTRGKILTTYKRDKQLTLIGQTVGQAITGKNIWYMVNIEGGTEPGWIFSDNVTIVSGDPQTLPTISTGTATPTPKISGATPTPTVLGGGTPTRRP